MRYKNCNKIVLKVGSSLIAPSGNGCSVEHTLPIARFIQQCQKDKKQVILVSSGSVAAGRSQIEFTGDSPSLSQKQAMAAIGQNTMMENWRRFFDKPCAQLLVTHGEINDPSCRENIKNTINELLKNKLLPIVNENDTVATEELKVGDNDRLAAMIAELIKSDLFMIASDVNGLFTSDPKLNSNAQHIPVVPKINSEIRSLAGGTINKLATGGMATKIEAATNATSNGIPTILFDASNSDNLQNFVANKPIGSLFQAND